MVKPAPMSKLRLLASIVKQCVFQKIRKINYGIYGYYKRVEDVDISPLFVLGSNRSGTSLISSLLAQHHQLEGIFGKSNTPKLKIDNHILAYCTSHHVWDFFNPLGNWGQKDEGALWGHPKHISRYYRDNPIDKQESLLLANLLRSYMKTEKTPLVNSHFNMLKIGLLAKVFPNAKFVLIIRDYQDYIRSCSQKWTKQDIDIEFPKIGLHWLTLNSCCIYDLKKYAPENFTILDYSTLFHDHKTVNNMLNEKLETIGLGEFDYDLGIVNAKHRYLGEEHITYLQYEDFFGCIDPLLSFERILTDDSP